MKIPLGSLAFLFATISLVGGAAEPERISDRACLFLDDRFVSQQTGLKRVWHQGTPRPEPAITGHWPHLFGSVLYDEKTGLYKMYYEELYQDVGWLHYAESRDGKNWTKPALGFVEVDGSRANNVIWKGAELPAVFIDPKAVDPKERFKMFIWAQPQGARGENIRGLIRIRGEIVSGLTVLRSADGIDWAPLDRATMPYPDQDSSAAQSVRDANIVTWDPLGERYYGTFRIFPTVPGLLGFYRDREYPTTRKTKMDAVGGHRRSVGITTSKDLFQGWTPIATALKPDARDDEKARRLGRDPQKFDYCELYTMPSFVLGNHYLGLVSLLFWVDGSDTHPGGGDLQLTYSHDGAKWNRQPDRQTLVAPATPGLVPCFAPSGAPLQLGDEMWIYYTEATAAHCGVSLGPLSDGFVASHQAIIRAAVWRRDGFVSLDADAKGTLTTTPMIFDGEKLCLNLKLAPAGRARVALLDAAGQAIPGFALADCEPLSGDAVSAVVRWKGGNSVATLAGKPIRIGIELTEGQLWSFRFSK